MSETSIKKQTKPIVLKIIIVFYFFAFLLFLIVSLISFFKNDIITQLPDFSKINLNVFPEVFIVFGTIMAGLSLLYLIFAIGLTFQKNWARLGIIILCIINIIGGIFSVTEGNYISIINLLVNLIIGSYLLFSKKTKALFKKTKKQENETVKEAITKIDKNNLEKDSKKDKEEIKKIIENIKEKHNKK
jgi:hypothetical protein